MSLRDGFTPKMRPVSPRRSAIVAALDIGTSKIVCMIARLKPQGSQEELRRVALAGEKWDYRPGSCLWTEMVRDVYFPAAPLLSALLVGGLLGRARPRNE